jgi:dCTP deaminase
MGVLAKSEILKEIEAGNIRIDPFDERAIGPASVDLHLSDAFRVFVHLPNEIVIDEQMDYRAATKGFRVPEDGTLVMKPGQTLLGITRERIGLATGLCGLLEGRSRFARVGLLVHISASFMQPGIENHQVLEMSNFGPIPLRIRPGTAICQFVFLRVDGSARYEGAFKGQTPEDFWKD